MKIEKKVLTSLHRCYATGSTIINGADKIIFATEGQGAAYMYSTDDFHQSTIWDNPGGTMSIVPVPDKNGDFLAVQNFFPTFDSAEATIVWAHLEDNEQWSIKTILHLPYVHRFDIITGEDGTHYFIGCTLCTSKTDKNDWSDPGRIYVGKLPDDLNTPIKLNIIKGNLLRNHGYSHTIWNNKMAGMITAENGVFAVTPPAKFGEDWSIEQINDIPTSDIAVGDIDNDGIDELITIEPFHGNRFVIRHKSEEGYKPVYEYPEPMEFGHVVWTGKLRGIPTIIGGQRRNSKDLFYIQYKNGQYIKTTIDEGIGPSNVYVLNKKNHDIIISANREIGEAVIYIVTD